MRTEIHNLYLLLGSNEGERLTYLASARDLIAQRIGNIEHSSQFYETQAWGNTEQADFINQALHVKTALSPADVLTQIHQIEQEMGRVREEKWAARTIDIDIALFDDAIIDEPNLKIPHTELPNRNFVLVPLMEIAGDVIHPVLNQPIEDIYMACKDPLDVILLE